MHGAPWEALPLETKLIGVHDFARIVTQLAQLRFRARRFRPGPHEPGQARERRRAAALPGRVARDRGPWMSAAQWLRASLDDEAHFVEALPVLAKATSAASLGARTATGASASGAFSSRSACCLRCARACPSTRSTGAHAARLTSTSTPGLPPASISFRAAHPEQEHNILPCGPHRVSVIDGELALTVPLWR